MKVKYAIIAAVGIAAIAAAFLILAFQSSGNPFLLQQQQKPTKSISSGNFTVNIIEDSPTRLLAKVENNGPTLENTAAFLVKKGLNAKCEPRGIVVTNFKVGVQQGGKPVPNPSSIPGHSEVTIDSREANLAENPTGNDLETNLYVLKLQPNSIQATDLVQKVVIQQQNATELELYENCLAATGAKGYPLLLKILNAQTGTRSYFIIRDDSPSSSHSSTNYETALFINSGVKEVPSELYWPASSEGWLSANFTKPSGPAPAWKLGSQHLPPSFMMTVKTVSGETGKVEQFEKHVQLAAEPRTIPSLDFVELAKGKAVPPYPKYWEVVVDLQNKSIS